MPFEWKPKGRVVINEPKAVYAVMREGNLPKDREVFTALLEVDPLLWTVWRLS